jgi:signal transduction histidine kinase
MIKIKRKRNGPKRSRRKLELTSLSWLLLLAIVGVLVLTWLIDHEVNKHIDDESAAALSSDAKSVAGAVNNRVQLYANLLGGYRGLFALSSGVPSQSSFAAFYQSSQLAPSNKLTGAISFIANKPTTADEKLTVTWANDNASSAVLAASNSSQLFNQARDSGQMLASGPSPSLKDFSLILPIYRGGKMPSTLEARRSHLVGFMKANIRYANLFSEALAGINTPSVSYAVYSSSVTVPLFNTEAPTNKDRNASEVSLSVAGRKWRLVASAPQNFATTQNDRGLSASADIFGAAIIFLLIIIFYFQIQNRRERVLEQTKDEFVSLASHQLRAPLTAIRLYTEMLLDAQVGELNKKQREYLDTVQISTIRMADLVGEFLNISRLELGQLNLKIKEVHLEDIVESVLGQLAPLAHNKRLTISFDKPRLPSVPIEPNLYSQVVNNLVSNALHYTPDGGKVKVRLAKTSDGYQLDVADNGIGIPHDIRNHIFKRFYRAENAKRFVSEGTGLGLYLVKKVVDVTGGRVWYESTEHQGTTFHVIIPLTGMSAKTKGFRTK